MSLGSLRMCACSSDANCCCGASGGDSDSNGLGGTSVGAAALRVMSECEGEWWCGEGARVGGKREKELRSNGAGIGTAVAVFDDADADDVAAEAAVTPFVDKPLPLLRASAAVGPGDALGARRGGGSALPSASRWEEDCCCLLGPPASRGLPAAGPPAADGSAIQAERRGGSWCAQQAAVARECQRVSTCCLPVVVVAADRRGKAKAKRDRTKTAGGQGRDTAPQAQSSHRPQAGPPQRVQRAQAHTLGSTDALASFRSGQLRAVCLVRLGLPAHFGGDNRAQRGPRGQQSRRLGKPTATRGAGQTQKQQL
jgi:hypothetical protein